MLRRINVLWYSLIHSDTCINAPTVSAHTNLSWYIVDTVLTRISSQLHPSRQSHPSRVRPHDFPETALGMIHCWYIADTVLTRISFVVQTWRPPRLGIWKAQKKDIIWYKTDTILIQCWYSTNPHPFRMIEFRGVTSRDMPGGCSVCAPIGC